MVTGPRIGIGVSPGAGQSAPPGAFAPYPAPSGFHWEFVTSNGALVTSNGAAVVALVGN